jgi:dihydropteroate synthase-like protein
MDKDTKILLLTGRMAYDNLVQIISPYPDAHVVALPISIAAFTTPRLVQRHGPELVSKKNPDIILVSGLARGDYSDVSEALGVPVLKGTRNLSGLPFLLSSVDELLSHLSSVNPADSIIRKQQAKYLEKRINQLEKEVSFGTRNFKTISGLSIGIDFPPRVMAEIVDATSRSIEEGLAKAQIFSEWADILDIGATVEKPDPERIAEMVTEVRKFGLPVSVDTIDPDEIVAGVEAGAEIILSIDAGNRDVLHHIPEDVVVVCLPTNMSKGVFPNEPTERARICHSFSNQLREQGFSKILADPLIEAPIQPGLMRSLCSYQYCRELDENLPFLAGVANATEFIDADTSGINAIFACLGVELGISVLLSTEERPSTRHCIRELHTAAKMTFAAQLLKSPPKEIGFTSFYVKSLAFDPPTLSGLESFESIEEITKEYKLDPTGYFKIEVDHQRECILCAHMKQGQVIRKIKAASAKALLQEIISSEIVSQLDHAAYLGLELSKAEIALKLGHNYQQDIPWLNY